ncbi:hypothetical protein QFC21_004116 [Naganishia friedmannii]|uniref:Uncharacterized protein n=1 Tax=Naganishia friedmannii TaxID=89922 RepID=A0ACC2VKV1_9TREE|nr:hypothetical protein QFC21_004116 [Naganishia friedmannii]
MIATQNAYGPDSAVASMDVEIKSQFHESTVNVPELEIRYVKDHTTPDVIYDVLSHYFVSGGVIHSLRIGQRQPDDHTMTVLVRFFSIETYLEAFLPHIRHNKHFIDPTCVRIRGIPAGGRKLFDEVVEFACKKWGAVFDTKFKDRPEGCECYLRLRLPILADDMRRYDWRDPDTPPQFHHLDTSSPVYALWGSAGKPPGAFVDKDLSGFIPLQEMRMISQQLQQRLAMQHMDNPVYQQQQTYGMDPNSIAHVPPLQMPPTTMMMGNATPFPPMAGNATPFNPMAGNATPFNPLAGNATPWNPMSNYAATPFHSFDNPANAGPAAAASISNDPRFPVIPMPMLDDDMMPQDEVMPPVPLDRGFSRRANANNRAGATSARGGGSYASRGKSGRPAPVYSGSRRGSRSTNDGNDATDLSAVDVEVDAFEASPRKSSYSRSSSKGAGASRKRNRKSPPKAPRSQGPKTPLSLFRRDSDKPTRIHQLFPVEPKESEAESLRRAQENAIAWNEPENMKKLRVYEGIFDEFMEQMKAQRRAKYNSLNQSPDRNIRAEEAAGQEAPVMVAQEQV